MAPAVATKRFLDFLVPVQACSLPHAFFRLKIQRTMSHINDWEIVDSNRREHPNSLVALYCCKSKFVWLYICNNCTYIVSYKLGSDTWKWRREGSP